MGFEGPIMAANGLGVPDKLSGQAHIACDVRIQTMTTTNLKMAALRSSAALSRP
jgi:hypothetical protein